MEAMSLVMGYMVSLSKGNELKSWHTEERRKEASEVAVGVTFLFGKRLIFSWRSRHQIYAGTT